MTTTSASLSHFAGVPTACNSLGNSNCSPTTALAATAAVEPKNVLLETADLSSVIVVFSLSIDLTDEHHGEPSARLRQVQRSHFRVVFCVAIIMTGSKQ